VPGPAARAGLASLGPAKIAVSVTGYTVDGQKMAGKLSKSPDEGAPGMPTLEASRDSVMVRPALTGARQFCARAWHAAVGADS